MTSFPSRTGRREPLRRVSLRLFLFPALLAAALLGGAGPARAAGQASLYVGSGAAPAGGNASIDVLLSATGGAAVSGIQFDLSFDAGRASVSAVEPGDAAQQAGRQVTWRLLAPGTVRIIVPPSFAGGSASIPSGTLVVVGFAVAADAAAGPTPLEPDNASATDPNATTILVNTFPGTLTVTAGMLGGCCPWVVPASASAPGSGTSQWKTRLLVSNGGTTPQEVSLGFLEAGRDNSTAGMIPVSISAGEQLAFDDVVAGFFGRSGKSGAIVVDADSADIRVTSRTYNTGSACAGTFGQGIPALRLGDLFGPGETAHLSPVSPDSSAFRSNLGLVNLSSTRNVFVARLLDGKGVEKARRDVTLEPWSQVQLTNVVGAWGVTMTGGDGRIEVSCGAAGVRWAAYLSVVDNSSGDPAFFPAVP